MTYNYSSNLAAYVIEEDDNGVCTVYRNGLLLDWYSKKAAEKIVKQMIADDNERKPK